MKKGITITTSNVHKIFHDIAKKLKKQSRIIYWTDGHGKLNKFKT